MRSFLQKLGNIVAGLFGESPFSFSSDTAQALPSDPYPSATPLSAYLSYDVYDEDNELFINKKV